MAKGSSSSSPSSDTSAVFIDTNLDTHLAMVVSPEDTVADLKGKIKTEHALCFPNIGEITVQAMKVRRRASFYHLSDTMLVRSAFDGIKGTWFLHLDLVSTTFLAKHRTETARNIMSESDGQPKKHHILHTEHNASLLLGSSGDRNQGFIMNGLAAEKGLILTGIPTVHESQILPDALPQKLSAQGDSSLPNAGSCQTLNLQVSNNDQLLSGDKNVDASIHLNVRENELNDNFGVSQSELEKRSDPGVPEMEEPITEVNAAVGSNLQQKNELVADQGEKDGREEALFNPGVGANDVNASVVVIKKEKSRKRGSALRNDRLLENKSQHPSMEKKKYKKEKDGSFKEPVEDQVTGHYFECDVYSKETSELEKVLAETSSQEKHEINLASSEGFPSEPSHFDSSLQQNPTDDKHKKKKKKRSSKLHDEVAQSGLADNSFNKTNAAYSLGKQAVEENREEELVNNHTDLEKEPDAADFMEGTRKVTDGDSVEVGMTGRSSTKFKGSNCTSERLSNSTISTADFPIQEQVTNVNPEGPLDGKPTSLSKESNVAVILEEAEQLKHHAEVDFEVPANSRRSRKKPKSVNNALSKHDTLHSSVKHVNEETFEEASGNNPNNLGKESDAVTMVEEDLGHKNPAKIDSEIPSDINVRSSHHNRRKKSDKPEMPNPQSNTCETVDYTGDQVMEENPNEISGAHVGHPFKGSKGAAVLGEAAAVDSIVPSNPNDKKPKRSRKKSEKTELPYQESIRSESVHPLVKEATKEDPKESLEDNPNETSGSHLGHPGKEFKGAAVFGEAAAVGNPAIVDSTVPSNPNDKKSKRSRKKSGKNDLPNQESIKDESIHPFVKEATKENHKEALEDSNKDTGHKSKSATSLREDAALESPVELDSVINSDKENTHNVIHKGSAEFIEAKDPVELPKSDSDKINFIDYFVPKAHQHELVVSQQELSSMETETGKSNKEKTKRKRKLNLHPQDSTPDLLNPSIPHEQHMLQKKSQDNDSVNPGLVDPLVQLTNKELKTRKPNKKKNVKRTIISDVQLHDTSSNLESTQISHDVDLLGKKLQGYESNEHHLVSMSMDEKSKHPNGMNSTNSESKLQSLPRNEGNDIMVSTNEVPQYKNFDAVVRSSPGGEPVTQNHSGACADVSTEEAMADLAASSDSTEEDTPFQRKRYRVAVRKIPSKRYGKVLSKSNQEKTLLATSATIFNDATSGSSDDDFEINNRQATVKDASDNSSTSPDSDGDLEETQTTTSSLKPQAYMNSPGAESTAYGKNAKGIYGGGNILTQSSSARRKSMPLSMILKSSSSYKKAKLTASQSEFENTESQPVDVVLETQPDLASP